MKASSFSWISRTFSVKRNANVSKSYTKNATISMAKNYNFISPALYLTAFTRLLKFNLLLGKPLIWPHHCKESLSSGLICIQIFLGFPADKVSRRVKCHCRYILCHSNSRWWPPTVQHSKVHAVEEQMMKRWCSIAPPHLHMLLQSLSPSGSLGGGVGMGDNF